MRVLLCTDGSSRAEQAATLLCRMNFPEDTEITLIGVSEAEGDALRLETSFDRIEKHFEQTYPHLQRKIRHGQAGDQILKETEQSAYDLIALGASGQHRGLVGLKTGSTASRLARMAHIPLLVARNVPERIARVLFCTAAEAPSEETLQLGGRLIASAGAQVGLLHVMSQLALRLDSPPEDLLDTAQTAIERGTREGQHLMRAAAVLRQAGVRSEIVPRLRHGLVVDEVLVEIEEGAYDLLVIGRHYRQPVNRWLEILLEDVAGQLLSQAPCSALIV